MTPGKIIATTPLSCKYNILLVGTRKDEDAARAWNGVEEDMTESDILSNKNRIEEDVVKIN